MPGLSRCIGCAGTGDSFCFDCTQHERIWRDKSGTTKGAVIAGNKCISKASDKSYRPCASIIIDNCDDVRIEKNGITDMRAQVTAAVQITKASAKGGIIIKSLKSTLPIGRPQVLDER